VAALRKGMQSVAEDPAGAYDASLSNIPEADPAKRDVTIEVLRATVAMWQADTTTLGKINPEKWVQTHALLAQYQSPHPRCGCTGCLRCLVCQRIDA